MNKLCTFITLLTGSRYNSRTNHCPLSFHPMRSSFITRSGNFRLIISEALSDNFMAILCLWEESICMTDAEHQERTAAKSGFLTVYCPVACWRHFCFITKTCLYNFDPLKPHFYIVKLGFTGVYIIFLISAQKHRLWVLVRTASPRRF